MSLVNLAESIHYAMLAVPQTSSSDKLVQKHFFKPKSSHRFWYDSTKLFRHKENRSLFWPLL